MGCLPLHIENEPVLRVAYSKKLEKPLKKVVHYYPFGLKHKGYNYITSSNGNSLGQKEKTFQDQRYDDDLGLNWHAFKYRNYDASLARFHNIDPLAAKYPYNSTYAFSENKVIMYNELEGLETGPQWWMQYTPAAKQAGVTPTSWQRLWVRNQPPNDVEAILTDVTPVIGDIKGFIEAFTGSDLMTGEELSWVDRGLGLIFLSELRAVKKGVNALTDAGGAYGRFDNVLDTKTGKNITEKNHVPTTKSYDLADFKISKYMGSAHIMETLEHRKFVTTGSSKKAKAFRNLEAKLLKEGKFLEAFDINVTAIRKKYGDKYNKGLEEARQHYINEVIPKLQEQLKNRK